MWSRLLKRLYKSTGGKRSSWGNQCTKTSQSVSEATVDLASGDSYQKGRRQKVKSQKKSRLKFKNDKDASTEETGAIDFLKTSLMKYKLWKTSMKIALLAEVAASHKRQLIVLLGLGNPGWGWLWYWGSCRKWLHMCKIVDEMMLKRLFLAATIAGQSCKSIRMSQGAYYTR